MDILDPKVRIQKAKDMWLSLGYMSDRGVARFGIELAELEQERAIGVMTIGTITLKAEKALTPEEEATVIAKVRAAYEAFWKAHADKMAAHEAHEDAVKRAQATNA